MQGGCNLSTKKSRTSKATSSRNPSMPHSAPARSENPSRTLSASAGVGFGGRLVASQAQEINAHESSGNDHQRSRVPQSLGSDIVGTTHLESQEIQQPSVRKPRGLTKGLSRPEKEDERLLVTVYRNTLVEAKARDQIQPIVRKFYNKFHKNWADYSDVEKNALWEHFLVYCRFESPEVEVLGRKAWDDFCAQNYPKFLHRWKQHAINKHGSIADAKAKPPEWAKGNSWKDLCDYWLSDDFRKASLLRKTNRATGTVIPHSSGNIPYVIRTARMEKDLGRPLTQYEQFQLTHTKKVKGTNETQVVSKEAEQILDNYATKLREKHGDHDKPVNELEDEDLEVYKAVVGGVKKGHLLGRPREKWSAKKRVYPPLFEAQETSQEVKKLKADNAEKDKKIKKLNSIIASICQKIGYKLAPDELDLGDDESEREIEEDSANQERGNMESNDANDDEEDFT